jgi:hypothetical protein
MKSTKTLSGAGHDDYCNIRISREGLSRSRLEAVHRNVVYFARQYVTDHLEGHTSAAHLKIGHSTLFNSLQRGRNQSGGDFRILAELCFATADAAKTAEKYAQHIYMNQSVYGSQNQRELFKILDDQVERCANELARFCTSGNDSPLPLLEGLLFTGGQDFETII